MSTATEAQLERRIGLRWNLRALVRGRAEDPVWGRPALVGLLAGAALLYVLGLSASGYGNSFYAAAVQAASKSWKAFFFGSFDSSNFITVDKSPGALWVMDVSARLFGVNSWSILVPQALEGVAAVGLLYATVRRRFGLEAGLLAGAGLALTPVAVLMFRFNNPDALLTLLLVAAAYALTRALEHASTKWLLFVGVLVGLGFMAKMLQALTVVPGFALVYLLAAPTGVRRRIGQLLVSGVAVVASAGWWVAIVALWPASSRPYIGGSQNNSILNLIFGYNGFGRITGNERGSVVGGGGPGQAGAWGPTGITRLFGSEMGTQISWLLPAALILGAGLLWARGRSSRTDGQRAAVLVWGSWLVVTGLVLSFASGIIHPYYTVVLGPPIGALVGAGAIWSWRHRDGIVARLVGAAAIAVTATWAHELLGRTPTWQPWLRTAVLVGGLVVAVGFLAPLGRIRPARPVLAVAALLACFAAPAAYSFQTASTPHGGAIPSAGPPGASGFGFGRRGGPRGGFPRGFQGGGGGVGGLGQRFRGQGVGGAPPSGPGGGGAPQGFGGQGFGGQGFGAGGQPGGFGFGGRPGGFGGGALGGLLDASTPSRALVTLLERNAAGYRWVAATIGSNSAAGVQLAAGEPVMAIGGFNGTDPTPTLAQFQKDVAAGKIHYFLGGSRGGFGGGSAESRAITNWVSQTFTSTTVGGVAVYDLTTRS